MECILWPSTDGRLQLDVADTGGVGIDFEERSMKMVNLTLLAVAASAAILSMAIQPASAMPIPALDAPQSDNVIQVRDSHGGHHWRHGGGHNHGHGYDDYYDRSDDSGVLFKSFVTGTLFDGANGRAYSDHASACAARYRSYDSADNSYQPSRGPRRQCR